MYAIAIKQSPKSSWTMHPKVYDDREKIDLVIEGMRLALKPYKIQRIHFDVN